MEKIIILQGLTSEALLNAIDELIEKRLTEALQKLEPPKYVRYLSRNEVCIMLKVSLPTLHDWSKYGILKSYKIGSRVLYKSSEVEETLTGAKWKGKSRR